MTNHRTTSKPGPLSTHDAERIAALVQKHGITCTAEDVQHVASGDVAGDRTHELVIQSAGELNIAI
jgi:hypothetical protein